MAKFTLLELHLDGAEFTANAPGIATGESEEPAEVDGESESGGRGGLLALVVLLALVGVALAGKRLLGGGDDELPSVDVDEE